MATTKELEGRLGKVEATLNILRGIAIGVSVFSTGAVGLAAWSLYEIHTLDVRVSVLETKVNQMAEDIKEIKLQLLTSPRGSDKAKISAGFTEANKMIQTASAAKTLSKESLQSVSQSLAEQMPSRLDLPSFWQLTSTVISARNQGSPIGGLKACFAFGTRGWRKDDLNPGLYYFEDCTLKLDDPDWDHSNIATHIKERFAASGFVSSKFPLIIICNRCQVVFGGGKIIPIQRANLIDCNFHFDIKSTPETIPQRLTQQLLAAEDTKKVTLTT